MSTAEAIMRLRKKLGLNQDEFGKKLGITRVSVSRFENGKEPSNRLLRKLADIAEQALANHLHMLFQAQRHSNIAEKQVRLSSPGEARRVALPDLQYVNHTLELLANDEGTAEPIAKVIRRLVDVLSPYLNPVAGTAATDSDIQAFSDSSAN